MKLHYLQKIGIMEHCAALLSLTAYFNSFECSLLLEQESSKVLPSQCRLHCNIHSESFGALQHLHFSWDCLHHHQPVQVYCRISSWLFQVSWHLSLFYLWLHLPFLGSHSPTPVDSWLFALRVNSLPYNLLNSFKFHNSIGWLHFLFNPLYIIFLSLCVRDIIFCSIACCTLISCPRCFFITLVVFRSWP